VFWHAMHFGHDSITRLWNASAARLQAAYQGEAASSSFEGYRTLATTYGPPLFLTLWATGMRSTKVDSPPMMALQGVAAMSLLTLCTPEIGFRPRRLALISVEEACGY